MDALSRDHSISICNCFVINLSLQCRMSQVDHLDVSLGTLTLKVFTQAVFAILATVHNTIISDLCYITFYTVSWVALCYRVDDRGL